MLNAARRQVRLVAIPNMNGVEVERAAEVEIDRRSGIASAGVPLIVSALVIPMNGGDVVGGWRLVSRRAARDAEPGVVDEVIVDDVAIVTPFGAGGGNDVSDDFRRLKR